MMSNINNAKKCRVSSDHSVSPEVAHEDLKLQDRSVSAAKSAHHTSLPAPCYAQSMHIHKQQIHKWCLWRACCYFIILSVVFPDGDRSLLVSPSDLLVC